MKLQQRLHAAAQAVTTSLRDFARDTSGNIAMLFGLSLPVLLMVVVGAIDINRVSTAKVGLQDALDAAALAAARSPYTAAADIQRVGMDALRANLATQPTMSLLEEETTFVLVDDEIVVADARVNVQTLIANIVLPPYGQVLDDELPVGVHSEVNRSTKDIEVSLVLDVTGSMSGNRLRDLKSAANSLVDLVVQDQQNINRTRMALVPYSMGVNPGTYIDTVRGTPKGPTSISGASWMSNGWSAKSFSAVSKANPGVITSANHGLTNGDFVWISGVTQSGTSGTDLTTLLNNKAYRVANVTTNTFTLENSGTWSAVNTTGTKNYAGSGIFRKCQVSTCEVVITSANHGLETGQDVSIRGVNGMTEINNALDDGRTSTTAQSNLFTTVTKRSNNTVSLNGRIGPNVSNYSSGGTIQCLEQGCSQFLFQNLSNNHWRIRPIVDGQGRSCVSERTGANAYTDASASTALVGRAYASTDNPCLASTIQPLTDSRDVLHNQINGYAAVGSTAGQVGVGWGWYMVSPTFGSIFPAANRPDPYSTDNSLLKVVIIMTDGEFNTPYCNGVVAGAVSGSGSTTQHINCAATNGNPFAQAVTMCNAMKSRNIIVYTVGFDIGTSNGGAGVDTAKEVMEQCATDASHVYLPSNGASLQTAFAAIGRSISQLRISR
ncbi:pilus assembly protein TadG-related protein [Brevundimonas sp.]|uniref:pilus assembly protein TadG-related protein n=1 Tax=Brevundimonas sp. TaxID=1871086 RepID=UPI0035AD840F